MNSSRSLAMNDACFEIYDLCLMITHNHISKDITNLMNTLLLTALLKPDGTIRPILVEDCIIRTSGSALLSAHQHLVTTHIIPFNLGIKCRNGITVAALITRLHHNNEHTPIIPAISNSEWNIDSYLPPPTLFVTTTKP